MARIHAPEFEDFEWFPKILRDGLTGYLITAHKTLRLDRYIVPKLKKVMETTGLKRVVDLGSGGGGPTPLVAQEALDQGLDLEFVLTDLYPNQDAMKRFNSDRYPNIRFHKDSVNAVDVPDSLAGIRTMTASFHHMPQPVAQKILEDAFNKRQPIIIFEGFGRVPQSFVVLLFAPIGAIFNMPFVRPFRWQYALYTYLIPLFPFFITWDGMASWLRIYSPRELEKMTEPLKSEDYTWDIGTHGPMKAPYIVGCPTK
jgi:hypothetical protein